VTEGVEGWCTDPYSRHQARWMSQGKPTNLVRDGATEGRDPVRDEPFRVPPVPLGEGAQGADGLERADDPRSWEAPLPISARAVARRRRRERAVERGPFYWLPLDIGTRRMLALCVSGAGLLLLHFFGWVGIIGYGVAVAASLCQSSLGEAPSKRVIHRGTAGGQQSRAVPPT
jgi:hypothetical protein